MIDYVKLYNDFGQNNAPVYIFLMSIFILILICLILLFIGVAYNCIKENDWKNNIKFFISFFVATIFTISLLSIVSFVLYRDLKEEPNNQLTELQKYNIKNPENFRNNMKYLESEFEYHTDKEDKINEILNEFYKPTGKKLNTEIMEKLKK